MHEQMVVVEGGVGKDQTSRGDTFIIVAIAGAVAIAHLLTNSRYGLHRDELQTLSDSLHMDWGFVAYPPFTPAVERVSMALFGHWLVGLRLASVISEFFVVLVSGWMARELGGGRLGQAKANIVKKMQRAFVGIVFEAGAVASAAGK